MTEEVHNLSQQLQEQVQDFYGNTLGQAKGQLESSRSQLESLLEQLPGSEEATRSQIQNLIDSYDAIVNSLDEAAQNQGVEDTVNQAVEQAQGAAGQAQEAASGAAQQAQDAAGQATGQAQEAAGEAVDQATDAVGQVADTAQDVAGQTTEQAWQEQPEATEAAKQKAEELGVDLSQIEGSGANRRITVKDVTAAANYEEAGQALDRADLVPTGTAYVGARFLLRCLNQAFRERFPEEQVLPQELRGVYQALVNSVGWSVYELISDTGKDQGIRSRRLELFTHDSFDNEWMSRDEVVERIENTSGLPHNMADYALEFVKHLLYAQLQREDAIDVEHVGRIRSNDGSGFVIEPGEEHRFVVTEEPR